ncbi:gamma-glutamylcyclotransferase family protein [Nakamurella sp.]|uniref:gamma-glutamylcyclotransferase family protein n=1 Tax=Nakamurella sp. TaxID=1869182 RepID=UPI003B3A1EEE
MPRLDELGVAPDPRRDPTAYPGDRLPFDFVLRGDRVEPLAPADPRPAGRHAVVAFGSNAAPAQLAAKFGAAGGPITVTHARLRGFALGHSPHVSVPGYLPWVLVVDPGAAVECALLWLDDRQRGLLDATEPNYDLRPIEPARHGPVLRATGRVVPAAAYRGRWGALRWPGAAGPVPAGSQAAVFDRLATFGWVRELAGTGGVAAVQRRLAGDAVLRDRIRAEFAARDLVVADGWSRTGAGPHTD